MNNEQEWKHAGLRDSGEKGETEDDRVGELRDWTRQGGKKLQIDRRKSESVESYDR